LSRLRAEDPLFVASISVFLLMVGNGMLNPILPLYLETMKADYVLIGLTIAGFGMGRFVTDGPAGSISDKIGRRPMVLIGITLFAFSGLVAAAAPNGLIVFVARLFQGFGAGAFMTSLITLVGDEATAKQRISHLSIFFAGDFLGTAVGPLIGGYLYQQISPRAPFLGLSLLSVAAFAIVFKMLRLKPREFPPGSSVGVASLREVVKNRAALFLDVTGVFTLIASSGIKNTAMPIYLSSELGLSASGIGVVLAIIALTNAFVLFDGRNFISRLGTRSALSAGLVLSGAAILAMGESNYYWATIALSVVFGVGTALLSPSQAAAVMEVASPEKRGAYYGFFRVFSDIGAILGPVLVGLLVGAYGFSSPFITIGAFILVSGVAAYAVWNMLLVKDGGAGRNG
jgi:MFS family permease